MPIGPSAGTARWVFSLSLSELSKTGSKTRQMWASFRSPPLRTDYPDSSSSEFRIERFWITVKRALPPQRRPKKHDLPRTRNLIKRLHSCVLFLLQSGNVFAMSSFPDMIGEPTTFAFVVPFPGDPVLRVSKHQFRTGLTESLAAAARETRYWTTIGDCGGSPRTPRW